MPEGITSGKTFELGLFFAANQQPMDAGGDIDAQIAVSCCIYVWTYVN